MFARVRRCGVALLLLASMGWAAPTWAATVEANSADVAQLDGLKGIGLKRAALIVDERQAQGRYTDWLDLVDRVRGIGPASAQRLSDAGLTVNGRAYDGPPPRERRRPAEPAGTASR